jgi:hypothetical protein
VEVPDFVPEEWQRVYRSADAVEADAGSFEDERRARAMVLRLLTWAGGVAMTAVMVMWVVSHLPLVVAVVAFVMLGAAAARVMARWVLDDDASPGHRTRRDSALERPVRAGGP